MNLDAYLDRVCYQDALAQDVETLRALHRAHVCAIPFENLDIVFGRGISLLIDHIEDKLVAHRRGGYCYEHNLLFAAVLEQLGFDVTLLAARVRTGGGRRAPRTHGLLAVSVEGSRWLADVGFGGGGLLEPLPLENQSVARQGQWVFRLERDNDRTWLLQAADRSGWLDLYSFSEEPQTAADFGLFNHYTATHPRSPFVGRVRVQRKRPGALLRLDDREVSTAWPDGRTEHEEVGVGQIGDVLRQTFGLELSVAEARFLEDRLGERAEGHQPGEAWRRNADR